MIVAHLLTTTSTTMMMIRPVTAWDVTKKIPGIWKLSTRALPPMEPTILDRASGDGHPDKNSSNNNNNNIIGSSSSSSSSSYKFRRTKNIVDDDDDDDDDDNDGMIVLKLNADGTFRQCNEVYVEGARIVGKWSMMDDERIKFILYRQYYGPAYDIMMEGRVVTVPSQRRATETTPDDDATNRRFWMMIRGNVCKGRVVGSCGDTNFFRDGFRDVEPFGHFQMIRSVAAVTKNDDTISPYQDGILLAEDDNVFQ